MLDRSNRFRQRRFKKRKREAKQSAKEHGKLKGGKYDVLRCCPQVWLLESEHIRLIAEDYEAFEGEANAT